MRRSAVVLMALLFFCVPAQARATGSVDLPEARLLAAMKLWGDIKFFDPQAADSTVDWDVAFMDAEPGLLASATPAAYLEAVGRLIEPLHDPATHVNRISHESGARITVATVGNATVITIPHGTAADGQTYEVDIAHAVKQAAIHRDVLLDIRGLTESDDADARVLRALGSSESPLVGLIAGDVVLPRGRSREYTGYPNHATRGYKGYSASDRTLDAATITGEAEKAHRFAFLVDRATSVPSIAVALAQSGQASIYTTGGDPALASPSNASIDLTDGVRVTYRTGDLADIDLGKLVSSRAVASVEDAVAALDRAAPVPATSAHSLLETTKDKAYEDVHFPGEAMRMLAVARIYNIIRYFSPYKGLMHDDWDAAALQAIRDERSASDARSYVLGLMRFYAHLHDSHGYAAGATVRAEFDGGVPFLARYLHGEVVVTALAEDVTALQGMKLGDVIDAVDGVPVRDAMRSIEQYICSSTQQAADYAAVSTSAHPSIFAGEAGTTLTLRFHRPGTQFVATKTFTRRTYGLPGRRTGPHYTVLPGNVGYVDFDRLDSSEVDAAFDALKSTRAIVFDNRGYPRGTFWLVAAHLTAKRSVRAALFDTPLVIEPLDRASSFSEELPVYQETYQVLDAGPATPYLRPTVMLVDERAISQSEHSALFLRAAGNTRFVGTRTQGANGDVTSLVVPGGITLNFTGQGVRHADGSQLQRVGIVPDVRVEPAARDIASGSDVVLQRGLGEALRLAGVGAKPRNEAVAQEKAHERAVLAATASSTSLEAKGIGAMPLDLQWRAVGAHYFGSTEPSGGYDGGGDISLKSAPGPVAADFGTYSAPIQIGPYRGKTIRIRGYLRTENVSGGGVFWLRIDGPHLQFDNMQDRLLAGNVDWRRFAIVLRVPVDATDAYTGILLSGTGTVHASSLVVDIVPDETPTTGI